MARRELVPGLTTHVANVALNKDLGLRFLWAEPQRTFGLTSWSHETLMGDQLLVAGEMLRDFLGAPLSPEAKPFVEMPVEEKDLVGRGAIPEEVESYGLVEVNMHQGLKLFLTELWSKKRTGDATKFLEALILQADECSAYTNYRTQVIAKAAEIRNDLLYVMAKSAMPAGRMFCYAVLNLVRDVLTAEAERRGYSR